MNADLLYTSAPGRALLAALQRTGAFRLAAWFLRTGASAHLIPGYIKKNGIDMSPFEGQSYSSFAAFFARKKSDIGFESDPASLISPCDSLLSVYPVTEDMTFPIKGSVYALSDLVPDGETAGRLRGGLCLVFRLQASDYHHFCCFDDGQQIRTGYIPGLLHSVQPAALQAFPVFRLNRRWWSVLDTAHFGTAVQTEIGAMAVGGVSFAIKNCPFRRGDEMGNFELAGSTIALLLDSRVRERLVFKDAVLPAVRGEAEVPVRMGEAIGRLSRPVCE